MAEWLTLRQVAAYMGLSRDTVRRRLILTHEIPSSRIGRQYRVDAEDLRRYLRAHPRPNPFEAIDASIAPGGICTLPSQQDQAHRDNRGHPYLPPDTYD